MDAREGQGIDSDGVAIAITRRNARPGPDCESARLSARRGRVARSFHLYDNDKEQNIAVDVSFHPISLVIAVQANSSVEAILPQVKKIGSMLESFVAGDQGEAAVLAFDHRFQVKQEFTSDLAKISEALKKVTPGASSSRLIDAMDYGVRML